MEIAPITNPAQVRSQQITVVYFIVALIVLFIILGIFAHFYGVNELDVGITTAIQHLRTPAMDHLAETLTFFGNFTTICILTLVLASWFFLRKMTWTGWWVMATLLSFPINIILKTAVNRLRPQGDLVQIVTATNGLSFPSGHTMSSIVLYGFAGFLIWSLRKPSLTRNLVLAGIGVLLFGVGLSRIYLGVHWFSDVFGGWVAGSVLLLLLIEGYRWLKPRAPEQEAAKQVV